MDPPPPRLRHKAQVGTSNVLKLHTPSTWITAMPKRDPCRTGHPTHRYPTPCKPHPLPTLPLTHPSPLPYTLAIYGKGSQGLHGTRPGQRRPSSVPCITLLRSATRKRLDPRDERGSAGTARRRSRRKETRGTATEIGRKRVIGHSQAPHSPPPP